MRLAAAERYALLIGIAHYISNQNVPDLDGALPDVDAMNAALTGDFGFRPENVTVLKDATRAGILAALDALIAKVKPGDYVLLYYSGHGTSLQDPFWKGHLPIDADTGAMIPADFRRGDSMQQTLQHLVVGRTDLRPRLLKLDGKATVLGLLDTCFSANLMKDIRPRGPSRSVPLTQLVTRRSMADDSIEPEPEPASANGGQATNYPYHTVAWISAALGGQPAEDIDKTKVLANPSLTFDGKPHGQFTNALIEGLRGPADRNHDGVITNAELYDYLYNRAIEWSHQPAWEADESNLDLPNAPLFAQNKAPRSNAPAPLNTGPVRVRIETGGEALRAQVARLAGIVLVDKDPDLLVRQERALYRLYQSGGVPLTDAPLDLSAAVGRIAAEPNVRRLLGWTYPNQRSNADISFWRGTERLNQGAFFENETLDIGLRTDAAVWPLVIDIDISGSVTVLYPRGDASGGAQTTAGALVNLGVNKALCPCGIDYLKAFLFSAKPAGYEAWSGRYFPADSPNLAELLETVKSGVGETTRQILTTKGQ
jgi:hypothetical protein